MNDELQLDPDHLRNRGARLAELGDRVGQTYAGLRDCLVHAEGSWGDDDMGVAFAREFKPHADQLLADLRAMAESMHGTAAGIVDAATQFEVQDSYGANQVGTTAADLDLNSAPQPDGSAGTSSPLGALTSDPAATIPAAGAPAYSTGRADPTERSTHGGSRTQDAAAGSSTPQGGPQRPDSSDRTGRGSDQAGSGKSGNPAGDSGRRPSSSPVSAPSSRVSPPSAQVLPPAAARNAAPLLGTASGPKPAAGAGRTGTPWTGQQPRTPGAPAGAEPNPSSPRYGSPPRPNKPADEPRRGRDRRDSDGRPDSDPMVRWLARTLAEHHGVQVAGFDTPGLRVAAVREFVAAVDRVLTDYPVIGLDVVAVAELGDESSMVRWSSEPDDSQGTTRSITLDQRTAQEPREVTAETDAGLGIYVATLGEFGRALDVAGGGLARRQAQRVLLTEYLRREPGRHRTLAEVVHGYQRWRGELTGNTTTPGEFDVSRALGAAFAEVVLHGNEAGIQAKILHPVLVAAASRAR
ncbi:hypothetical protein OG874_21945 [Nocardia sp. NBC_00565]|uniref:hypothetical protein n=1 Tax=Nocardia sp. NBC_00565 TaxID=2975993 RepID=UPI002E802499|nr:hypothetical protein [Nocardia sp. NBC_00565]WUC07581.1 hypothetical protein OG874_21945 [Nocardia sp. NBC_00565]